MAMIDNVCIIDVYEGDVFLLLNYYFSDNHAMLICLLPKKTMVNIGKSNVCFTSQYIQVR